MKTTKRLLSIALALLLGLAVLAPMASAADDPAYAPIITVQPKSQVTMFTGNDLVLEVEAELPEGIEGTLSYEWYCYSSRSGTTKVGTDAKLVLPITKNMLYDITQLEYRIYAMVTNTYNDDEGQNQTASTKSNSCTATVGLRLGDFIVSYLGVFFQKGMLTWLLFMHPEYLFVMPFVVPFEFITFFINSLKYK